MARHPNKEIDAAVEYALECGWELVKSKRGHIWGTLRCPQGDRTGCQVRVHSTPRNTGRHAQVIRHHVDSCRH